MFQRISHIILALWVLFSSTGFVLNQHFCRDELKSQSLFLPAESCHGKTDGPAACPMHSSGAACHQQDDQDDRKCCDDRSDYIKLVQDQQQVTFEYKTLKQPPIQAPALVLAEWSLSDRFISFPHYSNYRPPLLVCDRPVWLQVFLC